MGHAGSIRLVVLDFDGVIIESNDVKTDCFRDVFARYPQHLDAMMAFHHDNISASRFTKIDHLVSNLLGRPEDSALREDLARAFSTATRARLASVAMVPGARDFLEEFGDRVPLYLASVTPQQDLDEIVEQRALDRFFRGIYGCPPWTKASAVRDALEREHCTPGNAVLIGDSPGDRTAAQETGVEFVARSSGIPFDPPEAVSYPDLTAVAAALRARIA